MKETTTGINLFLPAKSGLSILTLSGNDQIDDRVAIIGLDRVASPRSNLEINDSSVRRR